MLAINDTIQIIRLKIIITPEVCVFVCFVVRRCRCVCRCAIEILLHLLLQSDLSAAFLRAARSGNYEKVVEFLKETRVDIDASNVVRFLYHHLLP